MPNKTRYEISKKWRQVHPEQSRYMYVRVRARRDGIPFEMSLEEFKNLISITNCPCCGREFAPFGTEKARQPELRSIDRLDPTGPYAVKNCVCICYGCNTKKSSWTPKRLRRMADWIETQIQIKAGFDYGKEPFYVFS